METTQASFNHLLQQNPMSEARKDSLRLDFERRNRWSRRVDKVSEWCIFSGLVYLGAFLSGSIGRVDGQKC